MINFHGKKFRLVSNSANGEVSTETTFLYSQEGDVITGTYTGGDVLYGHIIGKIDNRNHIETRYHHINSKGDLLTGTCHSVPQILPNGKVMLHEKWKWTCRDNSEGESVLEEI